MVEKIPLSSFIPGYYTLTVDLLIDGQIKNARRLELEISALPAIPRPIVVSRANLTPDEEMFITGLQLFNSGNDLEAVQRLALAFSLNPGLKQALAYGEALFRTGEYQKVIDLLRPYNREEPPAELVSLLGRCHHSLNQFAQASVY